jgi:hypothetical protein
MISYPTPKIGYATSQFGFASPLLSYAKPLWSYATPLKIFLTLQDFIPKSNSSHKCNQRRLKTSVFQTEYLELYEEAASRGLTILLPDIREDILIQPLKETVPLILAFKKKESLFLLIY